MRRGISIIYQELSLAPNLSVAENMLLGRELATVGLLVDRGAMEQGVRPVLERLGADSGRRRWSRTLHGRAPTRRDRARAARAMPAS